MCGGGIAAEVAKVGHSGDRDEWWGGEVGGSVLCEVGDGGGVLLG